MKEILLTTTACFLLASCAIGPNYNRPSIETPAVFKEASPLKDFVGPFLPPEVPLPKNFIGPVKPKEPLGNNFVGPVKPALEKQLQKAQPKDDAIRGKWWEVFGDAELSKLEEQVSANNQTVKAAEAAFRQARALVGEARAGFFPSLGANASVGRNSAGAGTNNVSGGGIRNNYNAELQASWVPDFWGRVRRQLESSKAGAEASAANLASAVLTAQTELAIDYFSLRIADEQKRLLERTLTAYTKSLEITQNQYTIGLVSSSDMLQAKVQFEGAQAQLVDIGVQRAQLEHAIAVLVGKAPSDFSVTIVDNVPALPEIPIALPSQLLERRPDIAAAERNVVAANAQIGVAEAAFFPDITLAATGGYASSELAKWFTMPNRFWSIGPSLVEVIFDAGLRAAQTEAAIAAYDQTVANYRQTVLTAFQEVEDNLAALRLYAKEAEVLDSAVKDTQKSVDVFLNQYKAGIVSYLNVTTAQTAELNSELSALNIRKLRLNATATLIEDLGGGWSGETLKEPSITQGKATPFSILPPSRDQN